MNEILDIIASHFGITREQLLEHTTSRNRIEMKRMAIYLLKEKKFTHRKIIKTFGYASIGTINEHMNKAKGFITYDPWFITNYKNLHDAITRTVR